LVSRIQASSSLEGIFRQAFGKAFQAMIFALNFEHYKEKQPGTSNSNQQISRCEISASIHESLILPMRRIPSATRY